MYVNGVKCMSPKVLFPLGVQALFNTWTRFVWPTRLHVPQTASQSAHPLCRVYAVTSTQTDHATHAVCSNSPRLIYDACDAGLNEQNAISGKAKVGNKYIIALGPSIRSTNTRTKYSRPIHSLLFVSATQSNMHRTSGGDFF